jgi:phage gp29-like protein
MLKSLHIRKAFANTFFKLLKTKRKQIERDTKEHQETQAQTIVSHVSRQITPKQAMVLLRILQLLIGRVP